MGPKFTVIIGTARGAFDTIEEAKKEAIKLARLNAPENIAIEDIQGYPIFWFFVIDGKTKMTTISYDTVKVDNDT